MSVDLDVSEELKDDQLVGAITYLLAGLEGRTNGHKINSVTIQQAGLSGFRVVIRAAGFDAAGDSLSVVGFSSSDRAGRALLVAEDGYKRNVIQWKIDRFAKSIGDGGSSKNGNEQLVLLD